MTPSPQGTTPSQAPAMSREEWTYRIDLIITWATNGFSMYDVSKRKADVLNAIMSLQSKVDTYASEICTLNNRIEDIDRTYDFQRAEAAKTIEGLQAEVERLRAAIIKGGAHSHWSRELCEKSKSEEFPCTCGLDDLIASFGDEKARQPK